MLKTLDARYRLAFESASAGMFFVDLNGKIMETNRRACEIFGLLPGALDGCSVNDLALPEDHHISFEAIQRLRARESQQETFEKSYRHRDGHIVHGLVSVSLIHTASGDPAYFISQMLEISNLKKVEMDLRVSEERLKFALAASGLGCWDWDLPSGQVFFDERALSMLGYPTTELEFDRPFWIALAHPEELARTEAAIEAHLRGEHPAYEMERRLRHKEGHWVWILERGKVISRGPDGLPLRMTGTFEEVSNRKRLENESANLLQQIERLMRDAVRPQHTALPSTPQNRSKRTDCLTRRQREVLRLVASGLTSSEIATQLHIATETVEGHRRDLMRKLDLHSVAALTRLALEEGLLSD